MTAATHVRCARVCVSKHVYQCVHFCENMGHLACHVQPLMNRALPISAKLLRPQDLSL